MNDKTGFPSHALDYTMASLAAIAAIAGAMGGFGAAGLMILGSKTAVRWVQAFAYVAIGVIAGLLTFLFGELFHIDTHNTVDVIRWSAAVGLCLPIALFSKNLVVTAMLRRFGWEIQFTVRKKTEDRRKTKVS
jgi:uncharacterized membrane protein YgdD (TMEM256/DUF423 family)